MEKFRRVSLLIVAIALLAAIMISPVMAADKGVAKGSLLSKTGGFKPAVTYIMAAAGTPGTGSGATWTPLPSPTYPTPGNKPIGQ